jgi:hypothetical protein
MQEFNFLFNYNYPCMEFDPEQNGVMYLSIYLHT